MTHLYDNLGIRFAYPDNWTISEERSETWPQSVTLETPGVGFWSLSLYGEGVSDSHDLVEAVLQTMREEYEDVEIDVCHGEFANTLAVGYELFFYCLDQLVIARVFTFPMHDRQAVLIYQAEHRELDLLEPVFAAITTSLIQEDATA